MQVDDSHTVGQLLITITSRIGKTTHFLLISIYIWTCGAHNVTGMIADPWVMSLIPAQPHTLVGIDREMPLLVN